MIGYCQFSLEFLQLAGTLLGSRADWQNRAQVDADHGRPRPGRLLERCEFELQY